MYVCMYIILSIGLNGFVNKAFAWGLKAGGGQCRILQAVKIFVYNN